MTKHYEVSTNPAKVQLSNGQVKTVKNVITSIRINEEADIEYYLDRLKEGVQIVGPPLDVQGIQYIVIQKVVELPFEIHGGSTKNLKKK